MSVGRLSSSHLLQRPASAALPALSTCPVRRAGLLREGGGRGAGYHRGLGQWRTPPRPHRNPKTAAGPKSTTDSEVPWRRKLRQTAERFAVAFERGEIQTVLAMLAVDVTFEMPPYPEWRRGRDAVTESWLMPAGHLPRP
jgi:hypothetical protein